MPFVSIEFAFFLPIVFGLYWFVFNRNLRVQNAFLVVASFVFYGWTDWKLLFLLAGISLCSYFFGILIENNKETPKLSRLFSVLNIVIGAGVLFVFKYYNFFAAEFSKTFLSGAEDKLLLKLILPVGLSFYVLRSLSYTIDVYKGKINADRDIFNVLAYISFFPHLLAGPIARPGEMLPQISARRTFKYEIAADGIRQTIWGLFKKIVIADNCALLVSEVFDRFSSFHSSTLVLAAVLYTIQIYADFSGYSDMAIGVGKLFGFTSSRNFNLPYFSRNIAEFWRRWHISLTSWFRDYVYIPLGGSRVPQWRIIFNTFVIFLLSGLWHGANWTFIVWGGYHALLFVPLILTGANRNFKGTTVAEGRKLPSIKEAFQMSLTFVLVLLGWIVFRSESIGASVDYIRAMFTTSLFTVPWMYSKFYIIFLMGNILILLLAEWHKRGEVEHPLQILVGKGTVTRYAVYFSLLLIMLVSLVYFQGETETFIYFQF